MKNVFGNNLTVTLYGESHGSAVGAVLDGLCPGIPVDTDYIRSRLALRRPFGQISTARAEQDAFEIDSGVFDGKTTGTSLCIRIPNCDARPAAYDDMSHLARPSHADYTGFVKYRGFADPRGGGHFSGRITAALVAAGAIAQTALKRKGITLGTHISRCAGIDDRPFQNPEKDVAELEHKEFAVLDEAAAEAMKAAILAAAEAGDSVGGILETIVLGVPAGAGEPWFDTVEGVLSHSLFSIPAVKGVEFGDGFALADLRGSQANDPFRMQEGRIVTQTNRNGGINGGITNGMPLIFRCVLKPTPSISLTQQTVDYRADENAEISVSGRHDPCIVHRARAVADAVTALTVYDQLETRFGTDWFIG